MYADKMQAPVKNKYQKRVVDFLENSGIHVLKGYITFGEKADTLRPAETWGLVQYSWKKTVLKHPKFPSHPCPFRNTCSVY